jgi:hypothetical protein
MNDSIAIAIQPPAIQTSQKTWNLWERIPHPKSYRLQIRDFEILEAVFRHRFLTLSHLATLFGGKEGRLPLRCRILWREGYLERPKALRPNKVLTDKMIYALGKKGAQKLQELRHTPDAKEILSYLASDVDIGELDWNETPKKQIGWPYIDHQLGVATFMVCLQSVAQQRGIDLRWSGHFNRRQDRMVVNNVPFLPDARFAIVDKNGEAAHHYLEFDRGNVSLQRMRERYERYFQYWTSHRGAKHFRVLTVTTDPVYMNSLRRIAQSIGSNSQYRSAWKGLWFTHMNTYDLQSPEQILDSIWYYADDETPVSLAGGLQL